MVRPRKYDKMTWQERRALREKYVEEQEGLCYWCKKSLAERPKDHKKINLKLFPKNFLRYPVHLHHSHETGLTIGAVHAECNAILWQYYGE